LDTPWPKVENGLKKMNHLMRMPVVDTNLILDALFDDRVAPDNMLPDTGMGLERERSLSSMFIKSPWYGSRSSTVLIVDRSDNAVFIERVYNLETFQYESQEFSLVLG
jgi:uncharacterized protein with NRDE domain